MGNRNPTRNESQGQRPGSEAFCARKLLVFMRHARIDFGEIDLL